MCGQASHKQFYQMNGVNISINDIMNVLVSNKIHSVSALIFGPFIQFNMLLWKLGWIWTFLFKYYWNLQHLKRSQKLGMEGCIFYIY